MAFFFISSLALCCLFCLYLGQGQYHLFMLLGTVCGGSLYFLLCSQAVRRALAWCFDILSRPSKKIYFFLKKVFPLSKKRVIILNKYVRGALPRRKLRQKGGAGAFEIQEVVSAGQTSHSDRSCLRNGHAGLPAESGHAKKEESAALSEQVAQLQQDNNVLQESIDNLQTSAGIEAIARNKLGLVKDGEIVFYDNGE